MSVAGDKAALLVTELSQAADQTGLETALTIRRSGTGNSYSVELKDADGRRVVEHFGNFQAALDYSTQLNATKAEQDAFQKAQQIARLTERRDETAVRIAALTAPQ